MPIYDFICQNCGSEFEKLVSFSNQKAVICPDCQSEEVERQMGLPAIHFKGSGWYITDSKSTNNGSQPADSNGNGASSGTEGDSKSESSSSDSTTESNKSESSKAESSSKSESSSASTEKTTKATSS